MELDNLGPVESFTLTMTRLPGGKFSVRSGTSTIETLNSGRSGARAPNSGRIDPCLRRRKVLDPEDQQPHWDLGGEATDELWCNDVTRARRYAVTRCYAVTRAECDAVTGARFERARGRPPTPDGARSAIRGATPGGSVPVTSSRSAARQMGLLSARALRATATSRRVINCHGVTWPCQSVY